MRTTSDPLACITAEFSYAFVVLQDVASDRPIPPWGNPSDVISSSGEAAAIRVLHGQEGEVELCLWTQDREDLGKAVFDGPITLPSGHVTVGDVSGDPSVEVAVLPGAYTLKVYVDRPVDASHVNVVLVALRDPGATPPSPALRVP